MGSNRVPACPVYPEPSRGEPVEGPTQTKIEVDVALGAAIMANIMAENGCNSTGLTFGTPCGGWLHHIHAHATAHLPRGELPHH